MSQPLIAIDMEVIKFKITWYIYLNFPIIFSGRKRVFFFFFYINVSIVYYVLSHVVFRQKRKTLPRETIM